MTTIERSAVRSTADSPSDFRNGAYTVARRLLLTHRIVSVRSKDCEVGARVFECSTEVDDRSASSE